MGAEKEKNGYGNGETNSNPEKREPQGCWENWQEFPKTVFAIFGNEFCERFSYYGMRTVLTLYVVNILGFSDQNSIALFHGFIVLCYSSPILGSILADGYIGKFHTILWISLFYACGNIVLAIGACYEPGSHIHPWVDLLGLIIIGLGTGGIKPCVSPFGGDQFVAGQEKMLEAFFHVFYFSINAGALISTFITPLIRTTPCRGDDTCFPAAFGMPAALMVVSVICFVAGSRYYKKFPPKENVIFEVIKTIHVALKNKRKFHIERDHWLEHYLDDHECHLSPKCTARKCHAAQSVDDIRAVLRQCVMCVPMPVFWALYDQQGSVWVLQAVDMDGRLWKGANLLPDQMTTLNAALILLFLPLFEFIIYPLVRMCGINPTPLRRMTVGGFLIAGCFIISMFVQFAVQKTMPILPNAGTANLAFVNTFPCSVKLTPNVPPNTAGFQNVSIPSYKTVQLSNLGVGGKNMNVSWSVMAPSSCGVPSTVNTQIFVNKAQYSVLSPIPTNQQAASTYINDMKKSTQGEGQFKLNFNYYTTNNFTNFSGVFFWCYEGEQCVPKSEDKFEAVYATLHNATGFKQLKPAKWHLWYLNTTEPMAKSATPFVMWGSNPFWKAKPWREGLSSSLLGDTGVSFEIEGQGGIYSLTLSNAPNGSVTKTFYTVAQDNSISILWQIPQYIVVTAAEILFSVTGLEFSYSQAPLTMKSVVGAVWLLTNAFGDLLVLAIEESGAFPDLAYEQLAFAIIMVVVIIIFMLLAIFWYEYSFYIYHDEEAEEAEEETTFGEDPQIASLAKVIDKEPNGEAEEEKKKKKKRRHHKHREHSKDRTEKTGEDE